MTSIESQVLAEAAGEGRLQSATAMNFVEHAFPTAIVPNRDLGIMVWSIVFIRTQLSL
jgi:hypothetical protein